MLVELKITVCWYVGWPQIESSTWLCALLFKYCHLLRILYHIYLIWRKVYIYWRRKELNKTKWVRERIKFKHTSPRKTDNSRFILCSFVDEVFLSTVSAKLLRSYKIPFIRWLRANYLQPPTHLIFNDTSKKWQLTVNFQSEAGRNI